MKTQSQAGKHTGTAGRLHATVPRMTSRTGSVVAAATATTWLKIAGGTGSAASNATACTLAGVTS